MVYVYYNNAVFGMKQPGFGKEGGKEAMYSFMNIKNAYADLN